MWIYRIRHNYKNTKLFILKFHDEIMTSSSRNCHVKESETCVHTSCEQRRVVAYKETSEVLLQRPLVVTGQQTLDKQVVIECSSENINISWVFVGRCSKRNKTSRRDLLVAVNCEKYSNVLRIIFLSDFYSVLYQLEWRTETNASFGVNMLRHWKLWCNTSLISAVQLY